MPLKTHPFDAAEFLHTPEDMAWYLIVAAEERDPAVMADAYRVVGRARAMVAEKALRWRGPGCSAETAA